MAIFGRNTARQRLRRAAEESLKIPAFKSPVDCTPWVTGGLWPAELSMVTAETAPLVKYLKADLQRITNSANEELKNIRCAGLVDSTRQAEEARVINEARAFAVRRVESTVRQLHNMKSKSPAQQRPVNGVEDTEKTTRFKLAPPREDPEETTVIPKTEVPALTSSETSEARHRSVAESLESAEPFEPEESLESAEPFEPEESDEPTGSFESTTPLGPRKPVEQPESVDPFESADAFESTAPVEPLDLPEPVAQPESVEAFEPEESFESTTPLGPREPVVQPEPIVEPEPVAEPEPAQPFDPWESLDQPEPAAQPEPVAEPEAARPFNLWESLDQPEPAAQSTPVQPFEPWEPLGLPEPVAQPEPVEPEPEAAEPEPAPRHAVESDDTEVLEELATLLQELGPLAQPPAPEPAPSPPPAVQQPSAVHDTDVSRHLPAAQPVEPTEPDGERLERVLKFVARQEPGLRWAVGLRGDGSTVLVTDLAHGWIPPGLKLPADVKLLAPDRRSGTAAALLGQTTMLVKYAPGDPLGWATDYEVADTSSRPRELPAVDDLGWLLGEATHWRDGLPRMVNTLAKAGAAGTGIVDAELDILRVYLDTSRYQLMAQYPDVDPGLLLNCLLLAATEAIATKDQVSANYHFAWFQLLSSPPASGWKSGP